MKILALSKPGRMQAHIKDSEFYKRNEIIVVPFDADDETVLEAGKDADIIVADAISRVSGNVIRQMKNLKMIHSEGVAFNGFDLEAASECGVYVCNCKAMNATAVAEQAVLLMLGLLRGIVPGDAAVRQGKQIDVKLDHMAKADLKEIADCRIGFIGFGDIAKATARICRAMGAEIVYNKRHPLSAEEEKEYDAAFLPLDELLAGSDIVTLHTPVTTQTTHMVDAKFLSKMKEGSYLVNTARGDLVVAEDLLEALRSGHLAGAGLDCIEGEPVKKDNPIFNCDEETAGKILFSPHLGGITASSFDRGFKMIYEDILAIERGDKPGHIVNEF